MMAAGIASADDGARQFELGAGNYKRYHYEKALYHFGKAIDMGLKDEKKDAARYAIDTLNKYKAELADIEKDEAAFRAFRGAPNAKMLSDEHWIFARRLMADKFYLMMVEPHLERSLRLDPDNIGVYFDLGSACYAAMQYTKGIRNFKEVIRRSAGMMPAYRMAGDAAVAIGDFDRARRFYSDLIKVSEKESSKYTAGEADRARMTLKALPDTYKDIDKLIRKERFDEAEVILRKRLSLNSADYVAMTALGTIYQDRGDRNTALRLFRSAIKIAPDYPMSHIYLGRLYYVMRKYDDAISEFRAFKMKMKLLPEMDMDTRRTYINGLYYMIEAYTTLERYGDAKYQIDEILRLNPREQDGYYSLGVYYYVHEHNRTRAYQAFRKTIDLDPSSESAKRAEYAIEYIRANPDSRLVPDFSFIDRE